MPLRDLLDKFKESEGVMRLVYLNQMRSYVLKADFYDVLEEVKSIWDAEEINILIGVGMRGALYRAVIAQKARLEGLA